MNAVLEEFLSWQHVRLKECGQIFMGHPVGTFVSSTYANSLINQSKFFFEVTWPKGFGACSASICCGALLFQNIFSNWAWLPHNYLFSFAIRLVKIEIETTETESHLAAPAQLACKLLSKAAHQAGVRTELPNQYQTCSTAAGLSVSRKQRKRSNLRWWRHLH